MKQIILSIWAITVFAPVFGQNQFIIKAGVLHTNTSVSEYDRGLGYYYYDSLSIDATLSTPHVALDVDIDLGKHCFLSTGLTYSKKGLPLIYAPQWEYGYTAYQEYMGMNLRIKYHRKLRNEKFGWFVAAGFRSEFTVAGPTSAEIASGPRGNFFNAFGTFSPVEFVLTTAFGASYRLGPGDIIAEVQFLNGLSDVLSDRYAVGRTFSSGISLGYSIYISK